MQETNAIEVVGLEDDAEGVRVVGEELRLLALVKRALSTAKAATESATRGKSLDEARLLELRDEAATAKPEDLPSIFEQMHHIGALHAQRGKGATGALDMRSPYFGHLRLEEQGKRRDILIGPRSYVDSDAGVRVVDWRHAPVSRIYYRYREGEDYEEEIGDRMVEGVVVARRSVTIADGELVRVGGPQGTFVRDPSGAWKRATTSTARLVTQRSIEKAAGVARASLPDLREGVPRDSRSLTAGGPSAKGGDKHLPAIAALLDPAQFDLVTRSDGLVVVQGGAGSGKTTVGLHRVAYLAFADPSRFRPDRMMVVVPHDALRHYVARVLPSLGVEGVRITTFTRLADRILPDLFPRLPTRRSDETPAIVMRAKEHAAMLRAVHDLADRKHAELDAITAHAMAKWPDGEKVVAAWNATRGEAAITPDARVNVFAAWTVGKRKIAGVADASGLPEATRGALEPLGRELRAISRDVLGAWDELTTSRPGLTKIFSEPHEGEETFSAAQLDQVHAWCVRRARILSEGERDGEGPGLDVEDVPILLRLWQLIRGPLAEGNAPLRFAHLFVDEVQDATPIALRVLLDLTTRDQSVTLAGDTAQRMLAEGDDRGEFNWTRLLSELRVEHATLEPLRVSYRSTAEITTFARAVLGPLAHSGDEEPVVTRNGPPVELFSFSSPGECVAFLADALRELARVDPSANVALVARFPEQADIYFNGLSRAEVPHLRRVAAQDFTWEPGVDVTDVRQTKGLEFDEVVLLETSYASYPETAQARHALYVGATRAANQLWCTTTGQPSDLVAKALAQITTEGADAKLPARR